VTSLYHSPQAAIIKHHRLGGLINICLFSYNSGSKKSQIKMSAGLASFEALSGSPSEGCLFFGSSQGLPIVHMYVQISYTASHIGLVCDPFYLNYFFKGPVSKCSHVLRHYGVRISAYELGQGERGSGRRGKDTAQPIMAHLCLSIS
jgi:hypothetical protein